VGTADMARMPDTVGLVGTTDMAHMPDTVVTVITGEDAPGAPRGL